jgi:Caspase domain
MSKFFGIAIAIGVAILTVVFPFDSACAQNQKRIALVVGNSNYAHVPKLPNPSRDAISVGQMFRDAGFNSVDVIVNATNIEFKRAIRKFEIDADQADIAVIFYAGHGIEIGGANYLIPIDARLASDRDAEDEAVTLDRVVASADGASKLRLIMLDDNPFTSLMRRDRKNREVSAGLGRAQPTSTDTLIAYAAKAGSTAEDGDGQHSPFTSAILKHLTNPGLDIRLAFGRVRDEVMRATGSRQEPYVYGALGGSNISLVPAPKVQDTPIADVKADYELVARIGTLRAWEVFLGTHKTGFYADLARVQIAALSEQQQLQAGSSVTRSKPGNTNMLLAGVPSASQPGGRESSSQEALDWNKIKDSTDPAAFEKFIQKYPDAPLAVTAQKRLEVLKQAAAEREAARKATEKAAEEARLEAERKKAEIAAAKKREEEERLATRKREEEERLAAKRREEEERRAKAAEAEQKARAAEAERQAARQRDEEERRARAAETEQKAKAAEAERQAAEARQRAEEAGRSKAAAEAAAARAETERLAKQAEAERNKAEQASALEAACRAEQAKFEDLSAKGSDGAGVQNMAALAKAVTCDRLRPQVATTLNRFYTEASCKAEQAKLEDLTAKGSDGAGVQNMAAFAKAVACDRLRPQVTTALNRFYTEASCKAERAKFDDLKARGSDGAGVQNMAAFAKTVTCDALRPAVATAVDQFTAEAVKRAATAPNAPRLVLAAQTELVRLGCALPGKPDGILNAATKTALARFASLKGRAADNTTVTEALVSELTKQTDRVCPLECKAGELAKGDKCVAQEKPAAPAAPAATSRKKDDDEDEPVSRKPRPEKRQAEKEQRRAPAPAPEPRARVQAIARPSGGGGGGHGAMIGVGF